MIRLLLTAATAAALLVAGCGGDGDSDGAEPMASEDAAAEAGNDREKPAGGQREQKRDRPKGTTISTSSSQFGEVLFDGDDQAIYYFDAEETSNSECYGECATAWPPVLTDGRPRASGGVRGRLLGTTERDDGTTQVTYAGRPLYYYHDEGPGELRCHDVVHLGGTWLAVQPGGEPVPT